MYRHAVLPALAGALLVMSGAGAPSHAAPPSKANASCFLSRDWIGWKPSPDSRSIYIHVNVHDYYRIDFSSACLQLQDPTAHLVTHTTGAWICHPLDLDLKVADANGFATPCIVRHISPMSRADIDALPPRSRP